MSVLRNHLAFLTFASLLLANLSHAQEMSMQTPTNPQYAQQQQSQANQNTGPDAQDAAPNSGVSGQMMKDRMFLRKATQGGLAEVQLGQLAAQKAGSQDVKDFGSRMVTDHTTLNDEMKPIADSAGVMLPKKLSAKDHAEYDKLNGLSGADFDTEYLTYMARDHHEDLRDFRAEAAGTTDPTLKAAVEKGARIIHEHSHMLEALAQSEGITLPARRPHNSAPDGASPQP